MRLLKWPAWPAAVAFGVGAEWAGYRGDLALTLLDLAVGLLLVGLGLATVSRGAAHGQGLLLVLTGVAWFAGSVVADAVDLHRGPLVLLLVCYPNGVPRSRMERVVVATAFVTAVVSPFAAGDALALVLAASLSAAAVRRYLAARGPRKRPRATALSAALAYALVLGLGACLRLSGIQVDRAALVAYELVVGLVVVGLAADSLRGRWSDPTVTGLVVNLGDVASTGTLREKLARALGDPSLVVGYRLPGEGRFVDEAGRPVGLPPAGGGDRSVTPIEEGGEVIAVLVHGSWALDDPRLAAAVVPAARLAVATAQLQTEVRARVSEVEASRRRIVEAADEQRRRLELELRGGAERRLARVAELLEGSPVRAEVSDRLEAARAELREFARGIHPAALTEGGLEPSLGELAASSTVPVDVRVPARRFSPALEAVVYFVCSEALTNVSKYARASKATVEVVARRGRLAVEIRDDGVGGADPSLGSGLRGLADRVEALGGALHVATAAGGGTAVRAELPLT